MSTWTGPKKSSPHLRLRHRAINPQTTTGSQVAEFMESHRDGPWCFCWPKIMDQEQKELLKSSHLNECGSKTWRWLKEIQTTNCFGTIFHIKLRWSPNSLGESFCQKPLRLCRLDTFWDSSLRHRPWTQDPRSWIATFRGRHPHLCRYRLCGTSWWPATHKRGVCFSSEDEERYRFGQAT